MAGCGTDYTTYLGTSTTVSQDSQSVTSVTVESRDLMVQSSVYAVTGSGPFTISVPIGLNTQLMTMYSMVSSGYSGNMYCWAEFDSTDDDLYNGSFSDIENNLKWVAAEQQMVAGGAGGAAGGESQDSKAAIVGSLSAIMALILISQ